MLRRGASTSAFMFAWILKTRFYERLNINGRFWRRKTWPRQHRTSNERNIVEFKHPPHGVYVNIDFGFAVLLANERKRAISGGLNCHFERLNVKPVFYVRCRSIDLGFYVCMNFGYGRFIIDWTHENFSMTGWYVNDSPFVPRKFMLSPSTEYEKIFCDVICS